MQSDPHLKSLADLLVGVAVRELKKENTNAHAVNRNVRQPRCIAKPGDCRRHADIEGSKR